MRRILIVVAAVSAAVFAARALADVTVTYLTANAVVDSVTFGSEVDGGVSYSVCGHVSPQGTSPVVVCTPATDLPVGAAQTSVLGLMSGPALTRYKNVNGL